MTLTVTSVGDLPQTPGIAAEAYIPDQLIAGRFPLVTDSVTLTNISSTGALKRGTVLGVITASGKYGIALSASADGSQTPNAILADDADPTGGDVVAGIYLSGEFNTNAMTFGTGITIANSKATLRDASIFLKTSVSAADPS